MTYVQPWQVRYYEADQQGVVFNAWYLAWFDEAFTAFLRDKGLSVFEMANQGINFQLVHSEIDWISGVRFGDEVSIAVQPARIGTTSFDVHYTVLREDLVTCTAKIVYVSISSDGAGKQPVAPVLRKALT
ncbi:acyl-CoA thioesterase [Nonomuraea sp. NPDC051191]|uniref:acyl-CoA thioesterase n=1 Tax=Nonomuraea sp. NPDC051191 TaxID=3364372 RepID=UPI0037908F95